MASLKIQLSALRFIALLLQRTFSTPQQHEIRGALNLELLQSHGDTLCMKRVHLKGD
jgi:hypothetical protein